MRHIIEVEEIVKIRHQIVVDVYSEDQIEDAINAIDGNCYSMDTVIEAIESVVPVSDVFEEIYSETYEIEYVDDYVCEDDE